MPFLLVLRLADPLSACLEKLSKCDKCKYQIVQIDAHTSDTVVS